MSAPIRIYVKNFLSRQICNPIKNVRLMCTADGNDNNDNKLNLARPNRRNRSHNSLRNDPMTNAIDDVADELTNGDVKQREVVVSELFAKLRDNTATPNDTPSTDISKLLTGIKIEKPTKGERKQQEYKPRILRKSTNDHPVQHVNIKLFSGPKLDIFTNDTKTPQEEPVPTTIFDEVEHMKLQSLSQCMHSNAFDEAVDWTNRGLLWKFPIDNEQDIGDESKVGFHEHVFLDHLIKDFPSKGPIRNFMELVITGLSKNAYLSVKQKEEHIQWFRQYFSDKLDIVTETTNIETKMNA